MARQAACSVSHGWQTVVGLEIHAQILACTKIFSPGAIRFNQAPNSQAVAHDLALPGTLPLLNRRCVDAAILTATALQAIVNPHSTFDRKHYFYYDMPAGFQITQQRRPIAEGGFLRAGYQATDPKVRIQRLQLEQDSAKSMHTATEATLVDYNRAGVGLMEIVTEPDMRSGQEAAGFVRQLIALLKTLGVSDGKLAEGSLRVDANVSLYNTITQAVSPRCEVKNINGLRFLTKAIDYESGRHLQAVVDEAELVSETRYYDVPTNTTISMRSKEDDMDYRFMPEPNIPPLQLDRAYVQSIANQMPELPQQRVERLMNSYGIKLADAIALEDEPDAAVYFEACAAATQAPAKLCCNWILGPLFAQLRLRSATLEQLGIAPASLAALVELIEQGKVTTNNAQKVLEAMVADPQASPLHIAQELDVLQQDTLDATALEDVVHNVIVSNPKQLKKYQQGQKGVVGFFVGQCLKQLGSKIDPKQTSVIVTRLLDSEFKA